MTLQSTDIIAPGSATPNTPRNSICHGDSTVNTSTPGNQSLTSFRLLYRGALSLPDSYLLLDGLTFSARLDSPSKHSTFSLLENPLALALESMRGRKSLRFLGVVKLAEVYLDESGSVEMDIHPHALLSRIYFENMFCLKPFPNPPSASSPHQLKSDIGIKVALGDSDGPETTQIILYAELKEAQKPQTIQLRVGRLTLRPPQPKSVPGPRPDDPIPRKPPMLFGRDLKRADSRGTIKPNGLKRVASGTNFASMKRPKLVGGGGSVSDLGSGVRLGGSGSSANAFKVPALPKQLKAQDVFGDVKEVQTKGKQKLEDVPEESAPVDDPAVEKANKNRIKKATIAYLAQTKDPARTNAVIDKQHPEFKEFYGTIYRGICFALRATIKSESVDSALVERLLKMHARMYLSGHGPPEATKTT